jgi:hypothetical protein
MNPLIHFKLTTLPFLIAFVLGCGALSPMAEAQLPSPTPDGGYSNDNTAEGDGALSSVTSGFDNVAVGYEALYNNTDGIENTGCGFRALYSNTTGTRNTATGNGALRNTTGSSNTATGLHAMFLNTNGQRNTGEGAFVLNANTTGSYNIALGYSAGSNLTTGSNNIDIGNFGVAAESNTIRIGTEGTQSATFISGISGAMINGTPVVVSGTGQLGVAPSSAHFKEAIKPMDKASEVILALKPVTFRYSKDLDPDGVPQFGLVAEDVEKVNPDLVAHDEVGKVYSVRYEAVNAMLLNEFLKEHRKVGELEATIVQRQKEFQSTIAKQQMQIDALTAGLRKVSAQQEASKPAPRLVTNLAVERALSRSP